MILIQAHFYVVFVNMILSDKEENPRHAHLKETRSTLVFSVNMDFQNELILLLIRTNILLLTGV